MSNRSTVSVMAEWHKNRKYLNIRLLRIPKRRPIARDDKANTMKLKIIVKGVDAVKDSFYRLVTVLKRMMLTISLKTPSPYTIENSLG